MPIHFYHCTDGRDAVFDLQGRPSGDAEEAASTDSVVATPPSLRPLTRAACRPGRTVRRARGDPGASWDTASDRDRIATRDMGGSRRSGDRDPRGDCP